MRGYYSRFKGFVGTVSLFTVIPGLVSFFAEKLGFNALTVFFVTLLIFWIASIEFRIKDLSCEVKK